MYNMYNNSRQNKSPRRMKVTIYTLNIEKYHEDKEYLLFTKKSSEIDQQYINTIKTSYNHQNKKHQ